MDDSLWWMQARQEAVPTQEMSEKIRRDMNGKGEWSGYRIGKGRYLKGTCVDTQVKAILIGEGEGGQGKAGSGQERGRSARVKVCL